jgi:hypothetical protein
MATRAAPPEPRHVGLDGCFIDEHQPFRV